MTVIEPFLPRSEHFVVGKPDAYQDAMSKIRIMVTMAIGTLKEVMSQVRETPGARFLIGEILGCLGHAKKAASISPSALQFKELKR